MDGVLQQERDSNLVARVSRAASPMTLLLVTLAIVLGAISFLIGPAHLRAGELFSGLFSAHGTATIIAREIRLPRALLALVVGAALGASGAALQGLFRNPLADPGVTGVTSSAGLGAVIAMYFGFAAVTPLMLPASAIAGALVTSTILYFLSRSGAERTALVLAGAAIASLATAMTALAMSLAPNPYAISEMVRWMMGSLKDCTLADLALATPPVALGIILLMVSARSLDAPTLGKKLRSRSVLTFTACAAVWLWVLRWRQVRRPRPQGPSALSASWCRISCVRFMATSRRVSSGRRRWAARCWSAPPILQCASSRRTANCSWV